MGYSIIMHDACVSLVWNVFFFCDRKGKVLYLWVSEACYERTFQFFRMWFIGVMWFYSGDLECAMNTFCFMCLSYFYLIGCMEMLKVRSYRDCGKLQILFVKEKFRLYQLMKFEIIWKKNVLKKLEIFWLIWVTCDHLRLIFE